MKQRKLKAEVRKVSAESRLFHADFRNAAQAAVQAIQNLMMISENKIAGTMATMDGLDLTDGWRLNLDTMEWVKPETPLPEE